MRSLGTAELLLGRALPWENWPTLPCHVPGIQSLRAHPWHTRDIQKDAPQTPLFRSMFQEYRACAHIHGTLVTSKKMLLKRLHLGGWKFVEQILFTGH